MHKPGEKKKIMIQTNYQAQTTEGSLWVIRVGQAVNLASHHGDEF